MAYPSYKHHGPKFLPGETLNARECLVSGCGRYYVCLHPDGNLVLYRWSAPGRNAVWSSKTHLDVKNHDRSRLVWRDGGQVSLLDNHGRVFWDMFKSQAFPPTEDGEPRPPHLPAGKPEFLVIQPDSNFVYYTVGHKSFWHTGTVTHESRWVVPDLSCLKTSQKSAEPGPQGTLEIQCGDFHRSIDGRLYNPGETAVLNYQAGTIFVNTFKEHPFDDDGHPALMSDSVVPFEISLGPGEVKPISIQDGSPALQLVGSQVLKLV